MELTGKVFATAKTLDLGTAFGVEWLLYGRSLFSGMCLTLERFYPTEFLCRGCLGILFAIHHKILVKRVQILLA